MARTTTTLVSAVAIVAATPVQVTSPAATALQAGTQSMCLHGKIKTVGGTPPNHNVVVRYKVLPYDGTDGIYTQANAGAQSLVLQWNSKNGDYCVTSSQPFPATGGYLHWWYEVPSLPYAATITITLVESDAFTGQIVK